MDFFSWAFRLILFILPAYFANSIPVLLGGGAPMDFGKKLSDGRRIFGDGKTWRGFFAGVLAGVAVGAAQGLLLPGSAWDLYPHFAFGLSGSAAYVLSGFLLGLGAMVGDLLGSFIKRRQGLERGAPSLITDQLFFLVFAILFSYPLAFPWLTLEAVAFLAFLTYFVHSGANIIANRLGLKSVPW